MNRGGIWKILTILFIFTAVGCREKLCYDHFHPAKLWLNVSWSLLWYIDYGDSFDDISFERWPIDWSKITPQEPEGVRLIAYPDGQQSQGLVYDLPKDGGLVDLFSGNYEILLYNNDTEYIIYEGLDNVWSATATTKNATRSPYSEENPEETTVRQPDLLFTSHDPSLVVDYPEFTTSGEIVQVNIHKEMHPVVYSYIIRYEIDSGVEYVLDARGAISGMAGTVCMADGRTLDDVVTVLYEDCDISEYGVEAVVRSFGLCNIAPSKGEYVSKNGSLGGCVKGMMGYNRPKVSNDTKNILTLELLLKSGNVKVIKNDVTEQMNKQPKGGVIIIEDIIITPEEGGGEGTGGFDIDVNDWNKEEIVDLPVYI